MPDSPISRRESLKRAAGALALGLGAPTAFAAVRSDADGYRLAFYDQRGGDPYLTITMTNAQAEQLGSGRQSMNVKFERVQGSDVEALGRGRMNLKWEN